MDLISLGWNAEFEKAFEIHGEVGFIPARITSRQANLYTAVSEHGEMKGKITGRMRHECSQSSDYPVVGDWVAVKGNAGTGQMQIHHVLPRKTVLMRADYNGGAYREDQIICANVDTIFIVMGIDTELNENKIIRYITQARASGANIVLVLNKADMCANLDNVMEGARRAAKDVPVLALSAATGQGINGIKKYLAVGMTGSLIGPSGVGKSSIINALLGDNVLATGDVRMSDFKGRHTTTWRELVMLPELGMLIDNPGMRSFGITGDEAIIAPEYEDVIELINQCKFSDCQHITEPGCAIKEAIANGILQKERFDNYLGFQRELRIISVAKSQRSHVRQGVPATSRRRKGLEDKRY